MRAVAALVAVVALLAACARSSTPKESAEPAPSVSRTTAPTTAPAREQPATTTVFAAGDIASCASGGDEATAAVLARLDGEILTLGDNAYAKGSAGEFANCYAPTWGRYKDRTHPVPGNHDYATRGARAYFAYFGVPRWYSWDDGGWHLVALNSNCGDVGGCGRGSPQERWLKADLAAHPARCTLAYWHHPRWSSGPHGSSDATAALWDDLAAAGADIVLAGHDHDYERFRPIDGIRSWVVGTGGDGHYRIRRTLPTSDAHDDTTFGVLALTLRADGYDWRFVPAEGTFTDEGSGACT